MAWLAAGLLPALLLHAAPAMAQATAKAAAPERFAQEVLGLVNQLREAQGLALLLTDPALTDIAAARSQDMASAGRLSHAGFAPAFAASGRQTCVENLAFGHRQPFALVAAWQASASHQRNLVAPALRYAGVVLHEGYTTFFACN
jgi:uncharacterized protein YkwD